MGAATLINHMQWMLQSVESAPAARAENPRGGILQANVRHPWTSKVGIRECPSTPVFLQGEARANRYESEISLKTGGFLGQSESNTQRGTLGTGPHFGICTTGTVMEWANHHFYSLMLGHIAQDSHPALCLSRTAVLPGRFVARGSPFMCQMVDRR